MKRRFFRLLKWLIPPAAVAGIIAASGRIRETPGVKEPAGESAPRTPAEQYNTIPYRSDAEAALESGRAAGITFHGAARMVGGSCFLVEYRGRKILVEAGLFYETALEPLDRRFEFDPAEIDHVIITHAHGDHAGRVPLLYRLGYEGKVYATPPTRDIAEIMFQVGIGIGDGPRLVDLAGKVVHSRDCEAAAEVSPRASLETFNAAVWESNLNYGWCRECLDITRALEERLSAEIDDWIETVEYDSLFRLEEGIAFRFHDAGHILGSAQVELVLGDGDDPLRIVFTGDYGNKISPLYPPPARLREADYLVIESTYGDTERTFEKPYFKEFEDELLAAIRRRERVIIPAFVLSKSQKIISVISDLIYDEKIPENCPVIVTSPTVDRLNRVYNRYLRQAGREYFNPAFAKRESRRNPFENPGIFYGSLRTYEREYGEVGRPAVIITSSGMMDFVAALELAEEHLSDPAANFFIVGWQSPESVGRAAMELPEVVIGGRVIPVRARVKYFGQFSSHADLNMLLECVAGYRDLKGVIVVHGEAGPAVNLARRVNEGLGIPTYVPAFLDTVWLDRESFIRRDADNSSPVERLRRLSPLLRQPETSAPPSQRVARLSLSRAEQAREEGNPKAALRLLNEATRRWPENDYAHYLAGRIHEEAGNHIPAIIAYRRAKNTQPYDYRYPLALGRLFARRGWSGPAAGELKDCLRVKGDEPEALALLGGILCEEGRHEIGIELLKAANSVDPYSVDTDHQLARRLEEHLGREVYYVSSRHSSIFHYPWCEHARRIAPRNLSRIAHRSRTLQKGLSPCRACLP